MCRTTDYGGYNPQPQRLKLTGFNLRLSLSSPSDAALLPDSLSLLLLPRLTAAPLTLNGSKIPSDSPAFLSLHRLLAAGDEAVFAAADRLRVSDGLSFEVHVAGNRLLKGVFRRENAAGEWTVECKSAGEVAGVDVSEAEVEVVMENGGVMREKVSPAVRRCRRRRRGLGFRMGLEDIPEERDECWCSCCCDGDEEEEEEEEREDEDGSDGEDEFVEERDVEMETREMMELEGVGWAVDVGFWVMFLGVGLLVSRASSRKLRRRKLLP